jgi:bleomycin hydrolase
MFVFRIKFMKKICLLVTLFIISVNAFSQDQPFTVIKNNAATPVKNQGQSGTCWCFSSTALVESELLLKKQPESDLSETFTVYNLYIDKAEKYIRRRGNTRFTEGGIEQDMLYSTDTYGAMPQSIYPGIGKDTIMSHDYAMEGKLKAYLDDVLKNNPDTIPTNWKDGFKTILNSYLGTPPANFTYNGKEYTPKTFAAEQVPVKLSDYIGLTSFTHHPYYSTFSIEVPDNYNSNMFLNLPLDEFIKTVKAALLKGYTVAWDADVSNKGFRQMAGLAKWVNSADEVKAFATYTEKIPTAQIRQELFDKQVTQDDHLMQITGLAKDKSGNEYFIVKNSWGLVGPYSGYIYVSMPYFTINTISVLINKKAVASNLKM